MAPQPINPITGDPDLSPLSSGNNAAEGLSSLGGNPIFDVIDSFLRDAMSGGQFKQMSAPTAHQMNMQFASIPKPGQGRIPKPDNKDLMNQQMQKKLQQMQNDPAKNGKKPQQAPDGPVATQQQPQPMAAPKGYFDNMGDKFKASYDKMQTIPVQAKNLAHPLLALFQNAQSANGAETLQ